MLGILFTPGKHPLPLYKQKILVLHSAATHNHWLFMCLSHKNIYAFKTCGWTGNYRNRTSPRPILLFLKMLSDYLT